MEKKDANKRKVYVVMDAYDGILHSVWERKEDAIASLGSRVVERNGAYECTYFNHRLNKDVTDYVIIREMDLN